MTNKELTELYLKAAQAKLVSIPDANALRRAKAAYKKNLEEPGDCKGNDKLLAGLAIAQADVGVGPGWIPETQKIGWQIADL